MKYCSVLRHRLGARIRIEVLLTCVLLFGGFGAAEKAPAQDAGAATGIRKVVFLGNSITLHAPAPAIGWSGNWGMAATDPEKDYVHLVTSSLAKTMDTAPEVMVKNIAEFERHYAGYDVDKNLKDAFAFDADLIIVAIGENVPELISDQAKDQFKSSLTKLLNGVTADHRPTIVVRSCFWPNQAKDQILEQACQEAGGTFVDISSLSKDESNYAQSERQFAHQGVAAHPGDKGMQAIADAILSAIDRQRGKEILTPPPPPEPRINGARVFGVRPGHPLLYTIAATGRRPMKFSIPDLPEGLKVDERTGQITGSLAKRGTYRVTLRAENALSRAERELRIVVGDELLLTPLLGCNTWGGWGAKVTDANLRAAAKAMVDTGLINHGWQYVNIDDGWQGQRGGPYNAILPNDKFPDMKALCDCIHGLGLKAGIYSTPWTTSYAGFIGGSSDDPNGAWERPRNRRDGWRCGKYLFDTNDARQWAAWGFDYAKYDWGVDRVELTRRMADALAACHRDIVMELSNSVPLDKAAEHTSLAQLSRTTGDLVDFWDRSQMPPAIRSWAEGVREVWLAHDAWAPYQRPGHWNHGCNLRIGLLGGWRDKPLTPTHLNPDEQYTHISLWCLWGSPMIIGTPIERLDPFTLSLLSNDEVLEINQDPLGVQGRRAKADGGEAVVKPLEDGSKAVGLLNPGTEAAKVSIDWSTLGLTGKQGVRDLWRQKDLGVYSDRFMAEVRPHGVVLLRLAPASAPEEARTPDGASRQ